MRKPQNAVALVRLSDLRLIDLDDQGNASGNVDQKQRILDYGRTIGWNVTRVIVENDLALKKDGTTKGVSAFKRRKILLPNGRYELRTVRPGFRLCLDLLVRGEHDGFITLDADRAFRDPRDLEDLIDIREQYKVPVESVTGSLRLNNDADITMARVMVAMANKSSRDTARRVAAARERQARAGKYGGGIRPFGWEKDGETPIDHEFKIIYDFSVRVVQAADADEAAERDSLRKLAAELRANQVGSVTGAGWSAETVRDMLLRPRNAGFMVYKDEEVADAPWKDKAPVPVPLFRAVQRILQDPNRKTGPGASPKWLGTTLFKCGICTDENFTRPVGVDVTNGTRNRRYRCKNSAHLARNMALTDKYVVGTILARLAEDDAVELLSPARPEIDVKGLRAEASAIRTNLREMAADQVLGKVSKEQLHSASAAGLTRITEVESILNANVVNSPLANLIGVEDIAAAWEEMSLAEKRLVIDTMVTVRILPATRRGRGFDTDAVEIKFKEHRKTEEPLPAAPGRRRRGKAAAL